MLGAPIGLSLPPAGTRRGPGESVGATGFGGLQTLQASQARLAPLNTLIPGGLSAPAGGAAAVGSGTPRSSAAALLGPAAPANLFAPSLVKGAGYTHSSAALTRVGTSVAPIAPARGAAPEGVGPRACVHVEAHVTAVEASAAVAGQQQTPQTVVWPGTAGSAGGGHSTFAQQVQQARPQFTSDAREAFFSGSRSGSFVAPTAHNTPAARGAAHTATPVFAHRSPLAMLRSPESCGAALATEYSTSLASGGALGALASGTELFQGEDGSSSSYANVPGPGGNWPRLEREQHDACGWASPGAGRMAVPAVVREVLESAVCEDDGTDPNRIPTFVRVRGMPMQADPRLKRKPNKKKAQWGGGIWGACCR
eukprot:gene193-196_t